MPFASIIIMISSGISIIIMILSGIVGENELQSIYQFENL